MSEEHYDGILRTNSRIGQLAFEMIQTLLFTQLSEFEKPPGRDVQFDNCVDMVIGPLLNIMVSAVRKWPNSHLVSLLLAPKFIVDLSRLLHSPIVDERRVVASTLCQVLSSMVRKPHRALQTFAGAVLGQVGLAFYDVAKFPCEVTRRPLGQVFAIYDSFMKFAKPADLSRFILNYVMPFMRSEVLVDYADETSNMVVDTVNYLEKPYLDPPPVQ